MLVLQSSATSLSQSCSAFVKIPEADDPWYFHIFSTPVLLCNFFPRLAQHGTC
uniref:Uncharacterized protein n=1 Tax=Hyaloperonospora arabidopsidis (strain Emoy2) TaxID=559515 RepID=M4BH72_HYAAE